MFTITLLLLRQNTIYLAQQSKQQTTKYMTLVALFGTEEIYWRELQRDLLFHQVVPCR
jgi:hypothetical protein